jgi:hypothetical protein
MPGPSSTTNTSNNSNSNYSNTSTSGPGFQPQASALTNAFNQAGGALTNAQSYTAPNGAAANLTGNGALSNNGVTLSNSGTNAATSGLGALSGYNAGSTNNPQAITDAATQYANGQNIGAQTSAAMQQAMEQVRDVALPGIAQNAAASGNSDSSRSGIAQGLVERSLAENTQNTYNSLYGQAYGNGLNLAQTQANNNNGLNLSAANSAASQGNSAVNTGQNAYSGALNNTGTANSINQGNYSNNVGNAYSALQQYMNLIGGTNWGTTTSSSGNSQTQGTGTSNTQTDPGLLSSISSGIGVLGALLPSDMRLKTDIRRVGMTDNGLPVYTYKYKGDPRETTHMGVMAQEAEQTHPEAVHTHANGYKMVDYSKVS